MKNKTIRLVVPLNLEHPEIETKNVTNSKDWSWVSSEVIIKSVASAKEAHDNEDEEQDWEFQDDADIDHNSYCTNDKF